MSLIRQCDYCGELIKGEMYVTISVEGWEPDLGGYRDRRRESGYLGHYHSGPPCGERSCYRRMLDAHDLAQSWGPTLESIETATGQRIAALRRKHRRDT